jgi:hypothetical protein
MAVVVKTYHGGILDTEVQIGPPHVLGHDQLPHGNIPPVSPGIARIRVSVGWRVVHEL